jgi:hypothetical protein
MQWIRERVRPIPPPLPWDDDLVGEEELRRIEQRREKIGQAIQDVRAHVDHMDDGLADEIEAIREGRRHSV